MPPVVVSASRRPTMAELRAMKHALDPGRPVTQRESPLPAYLVPENLGGPVPSILLLLFLSLLTSTVPLTAGGIITLYKAANLPPTERLFRRRADRGREYTQADDQSGCRTNWLLALLVTGNGRRNGRPCCLYHPELRPEVVAVMFDRDETFETPAAAASMLWSRLLDREGWLDPSFQLQEALVAMEALPGIVHFQVRRIPPPVYPAYICTDSSLSRHHLVTTRACG